MNAPTLTVKADLTRRYVSNNMRTGQIADRIDDVAENESERDFLSSAVRRRQRKENELMWALYRLTDRTQTECAEAAIQEPERRPKQSQISRIVSSVEENILLYCEHFDGPTAENPDEAVEEARSRGRCQGVLRTTQEELKALPEETYDAWLDWQARIILQQHAFRALGKPSGELPEWAGEVLPEEIAERATTLRREMWDSASWLDGEEFTPADDVAATHQT